MDESRHSPQNKREYTPYYDVSEEAPALEQRQYGGGADAGAGTPSFGKGVFEGKGKANSQTHGNLLNIFQCTAM